MCVLKQREREDSSCDKDVWEAVGPFLITKGLSEMPQLFTNKCKTSNLVVTYFLPRNKSLQDSLATEGMAHLAVSQLILLDMVRLLKFCLGS